MGVGGENGTAPKETTDRVMIGDMPARAHVLEIRPYENIHWHVVNVLPVYQLGPSVAADQTSGTCVGSLPSTSEAAENLRANRPTRCGKRIVVKEAHGGSLPLARHGREAHADLSCVALLRIVAANNSGDVIQFGGPLAQHAAVAA